MYLEKGVKELLEANDKADWKAILDDFGFSSKEFLAIPDALKQCLDQNKESAKN
jgi:hypothetical protein